ncbi:glycosyltransferase [Candidatus Microgenomates bacterium]|nr:MAG: glycosyltransferase [Candidatus Microgenomates bacterium]
MKILMLTPYLPYPLLSGGQIRSFNLLKNLAKKHEITLISLIKHDNEKKYTDAVSKFCHKIIVCKRPEKPWTITNILRTGFGKYPFLVVRNFSKQAQAAVVQELKTEQFDLIHAETFYVMPHIPETKIPILLVEQTIEYQVYQHFVETMLAFLRPLFQIDVQKIRFWEEYFWKRATRVVAMSEADKQVMRKTVSGLEVSIVPNGVDTQFFTFQKKQPQRNSKILFVGNFKWLQNREAASILVNKIWPTISGVLPKTILWIVGRFPTPDIINLRGDRVSISEHIEDIRQAYDKSALLLAPIYGPGGTRYKILEAMAAGLPVVTTPQGIEGLGVHDGQEAVIRTGAQDLAQAAIEMLTDTKKYIRLASAANEFVRKKYNWETIADDLDRIYESVAHEKY